MCPDEAEQTSWDSGVCSFELRLLVLTVKVAVEQVIATCGKAPVTVLRGSGGVSGVKRYPKPNLCCQTQCIAVHCSGVGGLMDISQDDARNTRKPS